MPSITSKPAPPHVKQWLLVVGATGLVSGAPIAVVWWLRSTGEISSAISDGARDQPLALRVAARARGLGEAPGL